MSRTSKKKAQKKRRLIIIAVLLLIAAVGTAIFFKFFKKGPVSVENAGVGYTDKEVYPGQDEREGKEDYAIDPKGKENKDDPVKEEPLPEISTDEEVFFEDIPEEGYLEVHFIDVGQGDAIFVRFVDTNFDNGDCSSSMLVDAGDTTKGTFVRNYLKNQGVGELEYLVCTHNDADHIGGAASVVSNVPIDSEVVFGNGREKDTKTYDNLVNEIESKWYSYEEPDYGEEYSLGCANFVFIAPTKEHSDENSSSLVMKLWYGDTSFLLTGDCSEEEEMEIIKGEYAAYLSADVLKVGHHGSKYSSSEEFLALVSPKYAVISCGEDNSYGHPHQEALNHLREVGCELFRTDVQGSVVAITNGSEITWNAAPCNEWGGVVKKTKL